MLIDKNYEVVKYFEGGMGLAFVCRDLSRDGKLVVLKTFKRDQGHTKARAAFVREAQAWIQLHSQSYLAAVDDIVPLEGQLFIKMPFYQRGSLRDRLVSGPLPLECVVRYAAHIVLAMLYLESRKLVHLDLKPENILISGQDEALITDLGLARAFGPAASGNQVVPDASGWGGTLPYMSPEMLRGEALSQQADIWAVGAIMYEMIVGERAFPGHDSDAIARRILAGQPAELAALRQRAPAELYDVVTRCLAPAFSQRFKTFGELGQALNVCLSLGQSDSQLPFWKRDRRVPIGDPKTITGWVIEFRPESVRHKGSIKYSEIILLRQTVWLRAAGKPREALVVLDKLLGPVDGWGDRWRKLLSERSEGQFDMVERDRILVVRLGQPSLLEIAGLRFATFLDLLYTRQPVDPAELKAFVQAADVIKHAAPNTAKLVELCGQIYMKVNEHDKARECFLWAWPLAKGLRQQVSTAACLLTLFVLQKDRAALAGFADAEVLPRFGDLEDAKAQETCARAMLGLQEPQAALHYLRRSLEIDPHNRWAIKQACICCLNLGCIEEARGWRLFLEKVEPGSTHGAELDEIAPELSAVE